MEQILWEKKKKTNQKTQNKYPPKQNNVKGLKYYLISNLEMSFERLRGMPLPTLQVHISKSICSTCLFSSSTFFLGSYTLVIADIIQSF